MVLRDTLLLLCSNGARDFIIMLSQSDFGAPAGNRFLSDRVGEMTRDGYQLAGKRRRTNTGDSDSEQRSVFMLSSGDDKLNIIFDEIVNIRNGQEKKPPRYVGISKFFHENGRKSV